MVERKRERRRRRRRGEDRKEEEGEKEEEWGQGEEGGEGGEQSKWRTPAGSLPGMESCTSPLRCPSTKTIVQLPDGEGTLS